MFNKNKLIEIMEKKHFTMYKLWKESGVAQSTLSNLLNKDHVNPSSGTLAKIANALDVSVDVFFDDSSSSSADDKSSSSVELEKDLPIIPKVFINPDEAREYVNKHQIFGSNGFDADKLDDNEILEFANELLKQMELISFKFKK